MDQRKEPTNQTGAVYRGIGINDRCVFGRLRFLSVSSQRTLTSQRSANSPPAELQRLHTALEQIRVRSRELQKRVTMLLGEAESEIFEVHGMLTEDEDLIQAMEAEIADGASAETAVERGFQRYFDLLYSLDDPYLSERSADVSDVAKQILSCLRGESQPQVSDSEEPYLLVADDLTPSETIGLDRSNLLGFVTFGGTAHSHTAILARAMGIPALVGVGEVPSVYNGCIGLLDSGAGTLMVSPNEEELNAFQNKLAEEKRSVRAEEERLRALAHRPAVTKSGHRVLIYANIGDEADLSNAIANGADGIGLLRSEFLYLSLDREPTEDELFARYLRMVQAMNGKRVVIRTLDVGADKRIPYLHLPKEENPALGVRGIRVCLANEPLFRTQLRAVLRASAYGKVALMLPMVVSVNEVRQSRTLMEACMAELSREGIAFDQKPEFGVMIETPAAAVMSEELAEEVDFFSVGTNDLVQYTLAADRQNPHLEAICNENPEPIFRLIAASGDAIHRHGGWIGVCGELAAEESLTQRFVALGIDELSVSPPRLLAIRKQVTECR